MPTLDTTSSYLGSPVAFTTEALFYAQSGYLVTVVMVQWSNVFACKSRKVILILILVFFDIFCSKQTYVRRYSPINILIYSIFVCTRC